MCLADACRAQNVEAKQDARVPVPENKALGDLIRRGSVTWHLGGGRPYESQLRSTTRRNSDGSPGRVFDAETRFEMSYNYECRCPWRWQQGVLRIEPKFLDIEWNVAHQVWLKRPPRKDRFWRSALVLHEMDHVRTSSHPAYADLFRRGLRQIKVLRFDRAAVRRSLGGDVFSKTQRPNLSSDQIRLLIKPSTQAVFDRIVELAEIRYRELDRLTDHGRIQLPAQWHEQQEAALTAGRVSSGDSVD